MKTIKQILTYLKSPSEMTKVEFIGFHIIILTLATIISHN